jgi:hypothetical protein
MQGQSNSLSLIQPKRWASMRPPPTKKAMPQPKFSARSPSGCVGAGDGSGCIEGSGCIGTNWKCARICPGAVPRVEYNPGHAE